MSASTVGAEPTVTVLIVATEKSMTRFEEWPQDPLTFSGVPAEPTLKDLQRELGDIEAIDLDLTVDAFCSETPAKDAKLNHGCRSLCSALGLAPRTIRGTAVFCFRPGVCRNGRSALDIAAHWYNAHMTDDVVQKHLLANSNDEDNSFYHDKAMAAVASFERPLTTNNTRAPLST